ncbi:MAG: zinc-binding dehydrogenase [Kiritimatiellae bacterium]|nr:zinc-binding dehydrogenase [Kiritimatiellia bacterium]
MSSGYQRGKAIVFTGRRKAELHEDVALPRMDDDGVVIRTQYSTISRGTEIDLYTGQMHGRGAHAQTYPILPGYMPCGEVMEVGANVSHLKRGDFAIGSNLFKGFDERYCCAWAGHCEYTVISGASHPHGAKRAVKVPDGVAPKYAALAVLGAVAQHGVEVKVKPQPGETVLVVGQGVIGNFAAQLCKLAGARVIVADLEDFRLDVSRACGLDETVNASQDGFPGIVRELTNGTGPDAVIEVTGEPRSLEAVLKIAKPYGRVHAQGMYLEPVNIYIPETLFGRNLTLSATCGEKTEHAETVIEHMAAGRLVYEPLLSIERPVDAATETYEYVHNEPGKVMTAVFRW